MEEHLKVDSGVVQQRRLNRLWFVYLLWLLHSQWGAIFCTTCKEERLGLKELIAQIDKVVSGLDTYKLAWPVYR